VVRLVAVYVVEVLTTVVHVPPPSVESSHRWTSPTFPDRVNKVEFVPVHTEAVVGEIEPPTEVGEITTFAAETAVQLFRLVAVSV
jgi:hypothetical protein